MKRRKFLELTVACNVGILLSPQVCWGMNQKPITRYLLRSIGTPAETLPNGDRVPFGWPAVCIQPEVAITCSPQEKLPSESLFMRISVAHSERVECLLHIRTAKTKTKVGVFDIRYSPAFSVYELYVDKKYIREINNDGIEMELESPSPVYFFNNTPNEVLTNTVYVPHFLPVGKTGNVNDLLSSLMSMDSLQEFGWREGCVLDGLWQVYEKKNNMQAYEALKCHLEFFFDNNRNMIYDSPKNGLLYNKLDGIEVTLPFAVLAKMDPMHPALQIAVENWENFTKPNGVVTENGITAEGCYTVAWPMAVIGKAWNNYSLIVNAVKQLKHRFVLLHENNFYLRYYNNGTRTFCNWARGIAWFLLGFARTIVELKDVVYDEGISSKFREAVDLALSMQRTDGLWGCFTDKDVLPDTSGSSGITVAILVGIRNGLLPQSYEKSAIQCWKSLQGYIAPDGLLKCGAQGNQGGVKLQESDYRIISQVGMGLMAQVYAELKHNN